MPLSKPELRKHFIAARMAVGVGDAAQAAQALKERFLAHQYLAGITIVAGYVPMRGEIDVMPLLNALGARGIVTALPVIDPVRKSLIFRQWRKGDPLIDGAYGIAAPPAEAAAVVPDLILVPLVAFDRQGHRLGYGGGYYDRTLSARRAPAARAIGMAYDVQETEALPNAAHDYRLDAILTPTRAIRAER